MRQLVGTIVLFSLISCAAATDVFDDEASSSAVTTTMPEVTVEGSPEAADPTDSNGQAIDLDARPNALTDTKITLSAPYLEVRAVDIVKEGGGSTMLEVRTADGWHRLPDELVKYWEDDPGCPSIERESSIDEIRVEQGAVVVVTSSDREVFEDEQQSETLGMKKARACRDTVEGWVCGEPTVVEAFLGERTYASKYWVDADGEIETEHPFIEAALKSAEPGT